MMRRRRGVGLIGVAAVGAAAHHAGSVSAQNAANEQAQNQELANLEAQNAALQQQMAQQPRRMPLAGHELPLHGRGRHVCHERERLLAGPAQRPRDVVAHARPAFAPP